MAALAGRVGTGLEGMLAVAEVVDCEDTAPWVVEGTLVEEASVAGVDRELPVVVVGTLVVGTLVEETLVVETLVVETLVVETLVVGMLVVGMLVVVECS